MALKLWSKLEDDADWTNPEVGAGGAKVGNPTYEAARFNNGVLSDIDNEGGTFPTAGNNINMDQGTIELWEKMKFASGHVDAHYFWSFYGGGGVGNRHGIEFFTFPKDALNNFVRVRIWYWDPVFGHTDTWLTVTQAWNLNDIIHWAVTWDRTCACTGGTKELRLYRDNVEIGSYDMAADGRDWGASPQINPNLYIGISNAGILHSDMVADNIKTFDTCKLDYSDRNEEGANVAPTAPTGQQVGGQSSPTGANCISDLTPGFTAIYNDPDAGDISNAINIQVGTALGLSDMWDSGWLADNTITPNRCAAKTYAGAALSTGTSYWWRCRFRDDDNAEGAWSEWQQFDICAAATLVQMVLI